MASHALDYDPIPINPTGAPGDDRQSVSVDPNAFGAAVGEANEKRGQAISNAGQVAFEDADQRAQLADEVNANDMSTNVQQNQSKAWGDFSQLKGMSATAALPDYLAQQKKLADDAIANTSNPFTQAQLSRALRYTQSYYTKAGQSHADEQLTQAHTDSSNAAISTATGQAVIGAFGSPDFLRANISKIGDEAAKPLQLARADQDVINQTVAEKKGSAITEVVKQVSLGSGNYPPNPVLAKKIADQYSSEIDPASRINIDRYLTPIINKAKATSIVQGLPGLGGGSGGPFTDDQMGNYLDRVKQIENPGGDPRATSPTGARGDFQFIRITWNQFGAGDINNPVDNRAAAERLTQANYQSLSQSLGRPPTQGELYLAHQQGADGAAALLANPGENAVAVLAAGPYAGHRNPLYDAQTAVMANGGSAAMTAGQFSQKWTSRFNQNGEQSGIPGSPAPGLPDIGVTLQHAQDAVNAQGGSPEVLRAAQEQIREVYAAKSATFADAERNLRVQEQARKQLEEQASDNLMKRIYSTDPAIRAGVTPQDVVNNPLLSTDRQEKFIGIISRSSKGDPLQKDSNIATNDLINRIRAPEGDPNKITDMDPLYDSLIAGKISQKDFDFAQKAFVEARSPEGERLSDRTKQFLDGYKALILKPTAELAGGSPEGQQQYYFFQADLQNKMDQYKKAGKDPADLLDRSKPDYFGSPENVRNYQASSQDAINAMVGQRNAAPGPIGQQAPAPTAAPGAPQAAAAPANSAVSRISNFLKSSGF